MPQPLVIIGLDGADWAVLERLFELGELPHLGALAASSLRAGLRSTLPPATLPAWNAFLCSAEPPAHGVIDQFVHPRGGYELVPATTAHRRLPTFLSRLAASGLAVASLGVPGTYPPERSLGLCIAGFDAPGASRAGPSSVWPTSSYRELADLGGWRYAVFNEQRSGTSPLWLAEALVRDLEVKERVVLWAYQRRAWDIFFVHLQASDTAGHHLWHTFDERSPRHPTRALADALPSVYRRIDALVGRLLALVPSRARLLVLSDHGMGGASDVAVHLNRALAELGLLSFRAPSALAPRRLAGFLVRKASAFLPPELFGAALKLAPRALTACLVALARRTAVDFAGSAAFSDELDYGPSIWINRRSRFAAGFVTDTEASALVAKIRQHCSSLVHPETGERLVRAAHEGNVGLGQPDLLLEPAWPGGYRASFLPSPGPGPAVRRLRGAELTAGRGSGMPGVHKTEGVLMAQGPGLSGCEAPVLTIAQAGALVYALCGLPMPADLHAPLPGYWLEILPSAGAASPSVPARADATAAPQPYTAAEQAVLTRRLRDLGYID